MNRKTWIIITIGIVAVGIIGGIIALKFYRRTQLSQAESLFYRGDYRGVVERLQPMVSGNNWAAEERLLAAEAFYRLRRYDEAQAVIDPLLRIGDETPRAVALSGWIWLKKDSYLQAQERFTRLQEIGDNAEAEAGLGAAALLRSQRYKNADLNEAETHLKRAAALNTKTPQAYLYLADLLCIRHDYPGAVKAAQSALDLSPFWSEPYVMQGRCYLLLGKNRDAEDSFQTGLQYGASPDETKFYLARSLYFQSRLQEALQILDELAVAGGEMAQSAQEDAAKICLTLGDLERAAGYLQKSTAKKLTPLAGIQLYEVLTRLKRDSEAEQLLKKIVGSWPFNCDSQIETGNRWLAAGEMDKAYSAYQSALDSDAKNYWANYNLGCINLARGDYYQAPDFFMIACKDFEEFFIGQINLALSLLAVGRDAEARPILQDLTYRFPENTMVLQARALERFMAGNSEAALDLLHQSLQGQTQSPFSLVLQGEIYLRLFQFQKAEAGFRQVMQANPNHGRAWVGLAHALLRLGNTRQAGEAYAELLKKEDLLTPALLMEVRNGSALVKALTGNYDQALVIWSAIRSFSGTSREIVAVNKIAASDSEPTEADLQELQNLPPTKNGLPEVYYNLALYLDRQNQTAEAVQTYRKLLDRYPSYLPALANLAAIYLRQGEYQDAVIHYERARKAALDRADLCNNEAAVYARMNQYDSARELLKSANERNSSSPEILYNQAVVALKQKDLAQAEKFLSQLKSFGVSENTQVIEGMLFAQRGDWSQAAAYLEAARNTANPDPYTAVNLGIALTHLEKFNEAEAVLQAALKWNPSLAGAHRALGILYCRMGLYQEAENALNASLRLDPSQSDLQTITQQIQSWIARES